MRDVGLHVTGSAALTYASIFLVSCVLCVVAVNLMARVNVAKIPQDDPRADGPVIEAA